MKIINKVSEIVPIILLTVVVVGFGFVFAANPAGNLDQCANGSASSPEVCTGSAWQNGNLNQNQAHYAESESVPFRIVLTDVPTTGVNTIIVEYDIKHGGGHAYDYLTSFDRTETSANPCSDVSPCSLSGTSAIPAPSSSGSPVSGMPTTSFNALPSSERLMSIYNGAFAGTGITYVSEGDLNAAQSPTRVKIQFTASNSTVVIAWGGHIASSLDWGSGAAASTISGSPYHMRFIELNGSGGNQDRSLTATVVTPPAAAPSPTPSPNPSPSPSPNPSPSPAPSPTPTPSSGTPPTSVGTSSGPSATSGSNTTTSVTSSSNVSATNTSFPNTGFSPEDN